MFRIQALSSQMSQRMIVPVQRLVAGFNHSLETLITRLGVFHIFMGYLLGRALILQELAPFAAAYFIVVYFIRKDKVFLTSMALLLGAASRSTEHAVVVFLNLAFAFTVLRIQERLKKRELNKAPLRRITIYIL